MLLHIMTSLIIYYIDESAILRTLKIAIKILNDVIICIEIIHVPFIYFKHEF